MYDLAKCPFCGDEFVHAELIAGKNGLWGVHCPNGQCPTAGNFIVTDFSEAEAVAAWNTRADFLRTGGEPWRVMTPEEYAALRLKGKHIVERDWDGCGGVAVWMTADFLDALPGQTGGGWRCPNSGEVYSAERLAGLLQERDAFIVDHGLWEMFVAGLVPAPPPPGGSDE